MITPPEKIRKLSSYFQKLNLTRLSNKASFHDIDFTESLPSASQQLSLSSTFSASHLQSQIFCLLQ